MNSVNACFPVERTVIIDCPVGEVFRFWRDFKNLSQVFINIREIQVTSLNRMRWFAVAPLGTAIEWDTEIVAEIPDKLIVWRSVTGSDLYQEGSARFSSVADGRGTRVTVSLHYGASDLNLARLLRQVFGDDPERELERDLNRFKEWISLLCNRRPNTCIPLPIQLQARSPLVEK